MKATDAKTLQVTLEGPTAYFLSIAGTFAGLQLMGDSLNLMSLGGLAVAIGLIIDDAVVVVDNRVLYQRPHQCKFKVVVHRAVTIQLVQVDIMVDLVDMVLTVVEIACKEVGQAELFKIA